MGKIQRYARVTQSTADCVAILNSFKPGSWKRKSKFNLSVSEYEGGKHTVRVFGNGTEFATIISTDNETFLCKELDLSEHKDIIDKVNAVAKYYWTHHYQNVYYAPYEKKLWVTGGDDGTFYSEESPQAVKQMVDNDNHEWTEETPEFQEKVEELNSSTFEVESDPDEDEDYILIGHINDICNIESEPTLEELKADLKIYEKQQAFEKYAEILKKIKKMEKK